MIYTWVVIKEKYIMLSTFYNFIKIVLLLIGTFKLS